MNKLFKKGLWLAISVVFATLLIICVILNSVISVYYIQIDGFLNIKRSEVVGLDEDATFYTQKYDTVDEVKAKAAEVCEALEGEGLVMLRNENNALPLNSNSKISLFGSGSVFVNCSAQGNRQASDKTDYPTFKEAFEAENFQVNETLWNFYTTGAGSRYGGSLNRINEAPYSAFGSAERDSFKDYGDAAVVVFTRDSIEGSDIKAGGSQQDIESGVVGEDGTYISLSVQERTLLEELTKLKVAGTFKKIVVLINSAPALNLNFLNNENISVDACLWIGNTGMSGVNAVAKVMSGEINPSGRLSDTYVYDNFSSPAAASWGFNENKVFTNSYDNDSLAAYQKYYGVYVEGVYVGYRYYETRYADVVESRSNVGEYSYTETVAYPFGYGLSYTQFDYSDFEVTEKADSFEVKVTVTNTGDSTGKEVVQVYLQKPYTDYAESVMMEVPAVELVGFAKTKPLAKGEAEIVKIEIPKEEFASYDTYGIGSYILDSGDYYLAVGDNSHDALNNILSEKGYTVDNGMDENGNTSLVFHKNYAQQDKVTYTKSSVTGNDVSNQLAFADPNRYEGYNETVTYVSRSDWQGTMPEGKQLLKLTSQMISDLQVVDIDDVPVEGELPDYGEDNGLLLINMRGKDYNDENWDKLLDQMTFEEQNQLLSLARNTQAVTSVMKPETTESDGPTLVKDTNVAAGGEDTMARFPCEGIWASTFNRDLIEDVSEVLASDCVVSGIDGLWCCGVNIHRTPFGGRVHEYFSEDPFLTGSMAEVEIKTIQSYGIIPGAKHFVFNDEEENRGGVGVWLNEQAAREIYLEPWKYIVAPEMGNAFSIMSSFNRVGCKWSSASKELITEILRNEFGFEGYVLTDLASGNGASYMVTLDGILAGTDAWLNYNAGEHSFSQYQNNPTVANLMRESCHRILYAVCNHSVAMNGFTEETRIQYYFIWYEALVNGILIASSIITAGAVVMYVISKIKERNN